MNPEKGRQRCQTASGIKRVLAGSLAERASACAHQACTTVDRQTLQAARLPDSLETQRASVYTARQQFPAGLRQPEGSFRFSMDALLLARFGLECLSKISGDRHALRFADLGTGCGVVGLAMLLWGAESMYGVGIEREPVLAAAARDNARRLGLLQRYAVVCRDVAEIPSLTGMSRRMRLVLANPPWLLRQRCRVSPAPLRRAALSGDEGTFPCFMEAAAALLEEDGRLALVTAVERRDDALTAMRNVGLFPYRLRLIETRAGSPACRMLLEGGLRPGLCHEETQVAHDGLRC